jgi:repressor LexA
MSTFFRKKAKKTYRTAIIRLSISNKKEGKKMPGRKMAPQEKEIRKIIAVNLNSLLSKKSAKKIEISKQTNIPPSTLTGYFNGSRLPTPENVDKLADFFHVSKEEIDPRFATLPENVIPIDQFHLIEIPLIGHIACG